MLYEQSMWVRGFTKFGMYQGIVKATVSGVVEDLKFKISEGSDPNCLSLAETANWAESRKHQFSS